MSVSTNWSKKYWQLPPLSVAMGLGEYGESEEKYKNFLLTLTPTELNTYTNELPTVLKIAFPEEKFKYNYTEKIQEATELFNRVKAEIENERNPPNGGRRKKRTRAKKLKRKTRRNK